MAYAIARVADKAFKQMVLLLLIMMPTWTAILIRVYAWMAFSVTTVCSIALDGLGY
jgi:putrescine transport system permease protein